MKSETRRCPLFVCVVWSGRGVVGMSVSLGQGDTPARITDPSRYTEGRGGSSRRSAVLGGEAAQAAWTFAAEGDAVADVSAGLTGRPTVHAVMRARRVE